MARVGMLMISVVSALMALSCQAEELCPPNLRFAGDVFGSYLYLDDAHKPTGIDADVVAEVGRRLGCGESLTIESNVRIMQRIEHGSADLATHKLWSKERERIAWLVPYAAAKNLVLLRKSSASARSKEAFLADKSLMLGVGRSFVHGPSYDAIIQALRDEGRVEETSDVDTLFKLLRIGRVNAIISTAPVFRRVLAAEAFAEDVDIEDWVPDETALSANIMLARSRFSATQAQRVAGVIAAMQRDGTLKHIFEKYVGPAETARMLLPLEAK